MNLTQLEIDEKERIQEMKRNTKYVIGICNAFSAQYKTTPSKDIEQEILYFYVSKFGRYGYLSAVPQLANFLQLVKKLIKKGSN